MRTGTKILSTLVLALFAMSLAAVAGVKISVVPESLKPGDKGVIKVTMSIPRSMHQSYIPGENDYFYLNADNPNLTFGNTVFPAPQEKKEGNEWIYTGTLILIKPFTVKAGTKAGQLNINTEFAYNICYDTGSCEPPETVNKSLPLKINGASAAPTVPGGQTVSDNPTPDTSVDSQANPGSSENIPSTPSNEAAEGSPTSLPDKETTAGESGQPATNNLWKLLIMAFLGGVILNIMPCVLPVLSIKAMSIVKQAHEDKKQILRHAMAYTFGILTSFIIMASAIIAIKMTGEAVGWGFQFQNTGFVMFLTSLVFIFALSLFDVFIIQVPGMTAATQAGAKGGIHGSFFGGMFAVLLATPCSAPMLGTALGFAFSQPPAMIMLFFVLIGLGLATPFILLGLNPKWLKAIPKPGEWMNIFKEVMGFLLIGTVIWLLNVVFQQNGGAYLIKVLSYLVVQGFAVWMYGRFVRAEHTKTTQWIFTILAILIIVGSVMVFLPVEAEPLENIATESAETGAWAGWQTFTPQLVVDLVNKDKPVFVDFGAKWCMTCISNEKTVILTDTMKKAFKEKHVQLVHGDYTKKNPEMQLFMKNFKRAGVPFYLLYVPGKGPKLFPEIVTIPMLKKALEEIE